MSTNKNYETSAVAYLKRATHIFSQRKHGSENSYYAALEMRCCIERLFFEYIWLIQDGNVESKIEKFFSPKDLSKTIFEIEPVFIEKLKFLNIILHVAGIKERHSIPNVKKLCALYGKIGSYLHAPRIDINKHFGSDGISTLNALLISSQHELLRVLKRKRSHIKFNTYGLSCFKIFHSGIFKKSVVVQNMRRNHKKTK